MTIEKVSLGEGLNGFYARPEGEGPFATIILFTEGFGLNSDMLEGSIGRLAEAGIAGFAPDIFHGDVLDGTDRDAMIAKIRSIQDDQVIQETRLSLDWIKAQPELDAERVGAIGFCMGGRLAFLAHAEFAEEIQATAAFYGGGIAPDEDRLGRKPLLDKVPAFQAPILLGYGAEDASITADEHSRIVHALSSNKKRFEFHLFTNAGHAFMSESRPHYAPEAAAESWEITIGFYRRYLG